jgi:hypothetical protein
MNNDYIIRVEEVIVHVSTDLEQHEERRRMMVLPLIRHYLPLELVVVVRPIR